MQSDAFISVCSIVFQPLTLALVYCGCIADYNSTRLLQLHLKNSQPLAPLWARERSVGEHHQLQIISFWTEVAISYTENQILKIYLWKNLLITNFSSGIKNIPTKTATGAHNPRLKYTTASLAIIIILKNSMVSHGLDYILRIYLCTMK